ncbi:Uncharacterized protein HZ326_0943 [Fusarium oxysporum f. sp. albedinis]|nr:Uncharacterized protein HZ326_0943 [Fusarium oxysporum f. sp. albedinis]
MQPPTMLCCNDALLQDELRSQSAQKISILENSHLSTRIVGQSPSQEHRQLGTWISCTIYGHNGSAGTTDPLRIVIL